MKLRSGRMLCKSFPLLEKRSFVLKNGKELESTNYLEEYFQSDFITLFYSIKGEHNYLDYHNNPSFETKYKLCNLYSGYKLFFNKEYKNHFDFLYSLFTNTLLIYKDMPGEQTCYICGMDECKPAFYCHNNHYVHVECFFEQVLVTVKPLYTTFVISNDKLRCDYCSCEMTYNYS